MWGEQELRGCVSLMQTVRGCVNFNKLKTQGKAVEVTVNTKEENS